MDTRIAVFQTLDSERIATAIRDAKVKVVLCIPGFDDPVGAALVNASRLLGKDQVHVVVDAAAHTSRLGYGHFDALKMVHDAGVQVRTEQGLRLGVLVVDDAGWCFAVPPLLVEATMERAEAPNAVQLAADQVAEILRVVAPRSSTVVPPGSIASPGKASSTTPADASDPANPDLEPAKPEIGQQSLTDTTVKKIDQELIESPPQKFDVARKVNVFNAFIEFVELKLTGVQIDRQRIQLPSDLLLAVGDRETRDKINASFKLIGHDASFLKTAGRIGKRADELRKIHTRLLPKQLGSVILRKQKSRLDEEFQTLRQQVQDFSKEVENSIGDALAKSRHDLMEALMPSLIAAPPEEFMAETVDPSEERLRNWLDRRLDGVFPVPSDFVKHMEATLNYKAVTYEMLNNPDFQRAIADKYPHVDFTKPFVEFTAARATD